MPFYVGYSLLTLFDTKLPTVRKKNNMIKTKIVSYIKYILETDASYTVYN